MFVLDNCVKRYFVYCRSILQKLDKKHQNMIHAVEKQLEILQYQRKQLLDIHNEVALTAIEI